jgi:alpha-tubulin suppressor-like RCC1 family protein
MWPVNNRGPRPHNRTRTVHQVPAHMSAVSVPFQCLLAHCPWICGAAPGLRRHRLAGSGPVFQLALTTGHRILTWGLNDLGQLGNGSNTNSATPVRVHLPAGFTPTAIGAGWDTHTGLAIGHQKPD